MTNRQRLALETKRKIIYAARQLIGEKGINGICVQDITDKAGVAKGSFYTYYGKKEDIVCEIAYKNFDEIKTRFLSYQGDDLIYRYLLEFMSAIEEGGVELCKSWTSSEILGKNGSICKFDFDLKNLAEILAVRSIQNPEGRAFNILTYLYGLMTVWCMTEGKRELIAEFKRNYKVIDKILEV